MSSTVVQGDLEIIFPLSPTNSLLQLAVEGVQGNISIQLPPAYEGFIWLESIQGELFVRSRRQVEDPTGKGRNRNIKMLAISESSAIGIVYWGQFQNNRPMSWVSAVCTQGSVTMIF